MTILVKYSANFTRVSKKRERFKFFNLALAASCFLWVCSALTASTAEGAIRWSEISVARAFTVKAPNGSRDIPRQGKDSRVGVIETPRLRLSYDFGLYSSPAEKLISGHPLTVSEITIDGHDVKIVTARLQKGDGEVKFFVAVHFPCIFRTAVGNVKLTLSGYVNDQEEVATAERIYRSITFSPI